MKAPGFSRNPEPLLDRIADEVTITLSREIAQMLVDVMASRAVGCRDPENLSGLCQPSDRRHNKALAALAHVIASELRSQGVEPG